MNEEKSKLLYPELSYEVMAAAIAVHKALGPGLREKVYHRALEVELTDRGLSFESKVALTAKYKGVDLGLAYEADIVVEGKILLELKSVAAFDPTHLSQIFTYMELSGCRVGYLLNFNSANLMHKGKRRFVR